MYIYIYVYICSPFFFWWFVWVKAFFPISYNPWHAGMDCPERYRIYTVPDFIIAWQFVKVPFLRYTWEFILFHQIQWISRKTCPIKQWSWLFYLIEGKLRYYIQISFWQQSPKAAFDKKELLENQHRAKCSFCFWDQDCLQYQAPNSWKSKLFVLKGHRKCD